MSTLLMPLPNHDFDPTESGVPWKLLSERGHTIQFATPSGRPASADPRMVSGQGLGPWRTILRADERGRAAYEAMIGTPAFNKPLRYEDLRLDDFDALILPGGHAPGMREYLESGRLQSLIAEAFACDKPVGAICHGVVLAARAREPSGRSVLHGRNTTALTRSLELAGWAMTALWLGRYYRTYRQTVEGEVTAALANPAQFKAGPPALRRDAPNHLDRGFTVRDGNYLSARWPGDAHRFSIDFASLLER